MGTAASTFRPTKPSLGQASRKWALPLSVRLVLTFALLVAATLLVAGALVIHLTRTHLTTQFDQQILTRVQSFQEAASDVKNQTALDREARQWLSVQGLASDELAAVRTRSGQVLTSTGRIELFDIPEWQSVVSVERSRWFDLETRAGSIRMLSVPLMLDGSQIGTVSVGASRGPIGDTISTLGSGITLASVIALAFAAVVGLASIRRAMSPLGRMSKSVRQIQARGDLSKRVSQDGPADEVGRLAEVFNAMLERLEHTFRTQQSFISDASHELRTPLTVARGQIELLGAEIRSLQGHRSHAIALEELDRVTRMVESLLLLARLDEGASLRREPVEVELVIREALLRAMLIDQRDYTVNVEPGVFVLGDPDPLLRALSNIFTNIVQHAGDSARITVTMERRARRVTIAISDDGRGIPLNDVDRIFERFFRSSVARSATPSGSGLGLAITASIVTSLGGEISVRSQVGHGTRFEIVLDEADMDVRSLPTLVAAADDQASSAT